MIAVSVLSKGVNYEGSSAKMEEEGLHQCVLSACNAGLSAKGGKVILTKDLDTSAKALLKEVLLTYGLDILRGNDCNHNVKAINKALKPDNKARGYKIWQTGKNGLKYKDVQIGGKGINKINIDKYTQLIKINKKTQSPKHKWLTQTVYKNLINMLHIRLMGLLKAKKRDYINAGRPDLTAEYCEDLRMEIGAIVIHMFGGHELCNNPNSPCYKHSQRYCKAEKPYNESKSTTFMIKGQFHSYPANPHMARLILDVLLGHYFVDKQIECIVGGWHSNSNESLHSNVYHKVSKDMNCSKETYQAGFESAVCDWNVGHERSITDRYDAMNVPLTTVQKQALKTRSSQAKRRREWQEVEKNKTDRCRKRHKKNNTDNTYASGKYIS